MSSQPVSNWGSNYRNLYERNQILLNNEELSDVKFQFDDNSIIFGHKFILAERSPVFQKMFFDWPMNEKLIRIEHITSDIFFKLLQYLYTDCVTWMNQYTVGPVMALAHKYGINHLEHLCYEYMLKTLSIENACAYLEYSYPFTNNFTAKLFPFIDKNCEAILLQHSFLCLSLKPLLSLVKRDTLVVKEVSLFKQLLDCIHIACKNSKPNSENQIVFQQVRFPTMNSYEFEQCIQAAPNFFTESQKVDIFNYIRGNLLHQTDNIQFSIIKREWKLIRECLFAPQEYNCTEGTKILSMRFRLANDIEMKEIEIFPNENCTYFIELINDTTNSVIFARFINNDVVNFNCQSLKLVPNFYIWKTTVYRTSAGTMQVSQSNTKGTIYVRTPKQQMIRAITNYAYVVKVPEFRSTMLCSTCYQPATTSTSPHRWQHCGKCAIIWNRDVNAGRNILYVGIQTLLDRPINRGFSRAFSFEKNATGYRFSNPLRKEKPWTKKCSRIYRKNIKITAGRFL